MNKWQEIAKLTSSLSVGLNEIWDKKLQRDASVIVGDSWSNLILDTNKHFNESQSFMDVGTDEKTGTLACLTKFSDNHMDFESNNQPFSGYILNSFDAKSKGMMENIKNPYAKALLQSKIMNHKENMARQLAQLEANVVMDKRHNMAIESAEKLAKATYYNPASYGEYKQDALISIESLSISPIYKTKLARKAIHDLATSAAEGQMLVDPSSVLSQDFAWKQDLDPHSLYKLEKHASHAIHAQQSKLVQQLNSLSKAHFQGILDTGSGIDGVDELALSALGNNEENYMAFIKKQEIYEQAHIILTEAKDLPLEQARIEALKLAPTEVTEDYLERKILYEVVVEEINKWGELAEKDPAKFTEIVHPELLPISMELGEKITERQNIQAKKGVPVHLIKTLTNEERELFTSKLESPDPNYIKQTLDEILSIEYNYNKIGYKIAEEILDNDIRGNQTSLSPLIHHYAKAHLMENKLLQNDFAQAIAQQGQLFGEFAKEDEKEIKKYISKDNQFTEWRESLEIGRNDHIGEIEMMKVGLLKLSRYYQKNKHLSTEDSSKLAVKNLLDSSFIKPIEFNGKGGVGLYVPESIIEDDKIVKLDKKNLNYNLMSLKSNLIRHEIDYDMISSFGKEYYENELLKASEVSSVLRSGQFKLTKDKKSLYYVYIDEKGEHPLLKAPNQLLRFNLIDFNDSIESRPIFDDVPSYEGY